jgi:hypothetical protein
MAQQYAAATRKTNNWLSTRLTPAKVQGVKRGARYFVYQIVGAVAANAAALAAIVLTQWSYDPAIVMVGSWVVASVAAAGKRTVTFNAALAAGAGGAPDVEPMPTLSTPSPDEPMPTLTPPGGTA